jgi:hypothetical protein
MNKAFAFIAANGNWHVISRLCSSLMAVSLGLIAGFFPSQAGAWRSAYYPEDWTPDFRTSDGKYLNDFSYAGYHRGEKELPHVAGTPIDVTQAPYQADPTGVKDSTAAIQSALNAAAKAGGGIVFLPAGTYLVAPPTPQSQVALQVPASNIVLRGAGAGKTFICNTSTAMLGKRVIQVVGGDPSGYKLAVNFWYKEDPKATTPLSADIPAPTTHIPVQDVSSFSVGDLVAVRCDVTQRFVDQVGMTGKWIPPSDPKSPKGNHYLLNGILYCRRVLAIDTDHKELTVDVPTRYPLLMADNARVSKIAEPMVSEVGLEDFSIGNKQHPAPGWETIVPRLCPRPIKGQVVPHTDDPGWSEGAFNTAGTPANSVHASVAIALTRVENSWVRNVDTYQPQGNSGVDILSNGMVLDQCRFVTVDSCDLGFPQYLGGGGDGYMYIIHSQECLLRNCVGDSGRHNFDFGMMHTSGNVLLNCTARNGKLPSDYHMYFSAANLVDGMTCDGDSLEANYRPFGGPAPHGVTTTQSVYWNTQGLSYPPERFFFHNTPSRRKQVAVDSHQWGDGYVIGTRGAAPAVDSSNHVEGVGQGDTLEPRSLYQDQLARRLKTQPSAQ